jgi:hypothetical protein
MTETTSVTEKGVGWLAFASVMLGLTGFLNVIVGLVALAKADYLVDDLLFSNLDVWGAFFVAWGVLQIVASGALLSGKKYWAAYLGIFTAFANVVAQLGFLKAFPAWSIIIISLDVLVIYAIMAYGGGFSTPEGYWERGSGGRA